MLSLCPAGDPKVVPSGIEDPEVPQPPGAVLEILAERPSCRYDPITLTDDIVHLKHQFDSCGRQPRRAGIRNCPPGGPDAHSAALQRYIRSRIIALILGDAEAQYPRVEVNGGIQIGRKDLTPQRHLHHRMVAYPSGSRQSACSPAVQPDDSAAAPLSSNLEHGRTRWPYPESVHRLADALDLRDGTRGISSPLPDGG